MDALRKMGVQAKVDAARQQLEQKAREIDYVGGVDMSAGSTGSKFCGNCGTKMIP
jgi:hypothetical protein